jgi:hypothetical protein
MIDEGEAAPTGTATTVTTGKSNSTSQIRVTARVTTGTDPTSSAVITASPTRCDTGCCDPVPTHNNHCQVLPAHATFYTAGSE